MRNNYHSDNQCYYTQKWNKGVCMQSASDYSPFGVLLDGRSMQKMGYRYGYQGSEKDIELKGEGNSYTTFFRQLDPRVGRWLAIDPKIASIPWQSPYCSMDNNPVFYTDPFGDIIDGNNKGKSDYQKAKNQANKGVAESQKFIDKWTNKIEKKGSSKRRERKLSDAKTINSNFNAALTEMKELEESLTVYYINSGVSYSDASTAGNLGYDLKNERVMVNYTSGVSTMIHELKHAYQYETETISLAKVYANSTKTNGGAAYDVYDEQEAYGRQLLFEGAGNGNPESASYVYNQSDNYLHLMNKASNIKVSATNLEIQMYTLGMTDASDKLFGISGGGYYRYKSYLKDYNDGVRTIMQPIIDNLKSTSLKIE